MLFKPLDFLRELWRPKYLYQSIAKWDGSESTNTYSLSINYDFLFIYIVNAVICVCIMDTFFLDTTFPIPTKFGTLNRPTRSASRALILVLYRPLSCKPNFRYHIVRQLQTCSICPITCPMSQCLTRPTQQTIASHNGGEQYRPEGLICSE